MVDTAIVDKQARAASKHWDLWVEFCEAHAVDPWFPKGDDPVPHLQVFAARLRDGRLSSSGQPLQSGTVSDYLRSIGQAYKWVGARDIRLDSHGATDFRLARQLMQRKLHPKPLSTESHLVKGRTDGKHNFLT